MKNIKIISCALISLFVTTAVMAKTEQITLKKIWDLVRKL